MVVLDQWIKLNKLPDELGDVLYEESISKMGQLQQISLQQLHSICDGLQRKMGNSFTQKKRLELINCIKEINPAIKSLMSGVNMNDSPQMSQPSQQIRSVQSTQDNKIIMKMTTYHNEYSKSLAWIKQKQQGVVFIRLYSSN